MIMLMINWLLTRLFCLISLPDTQSGAQYPGNLPRIDLRYEHPN
jgi:hypothetical protein